MSTSWRHWCGAAMRPACRCGCSVADRICWCATRACREWSLSLGAAAFGQIEVSRPQDRGRRRGQAGACHLNGRARGAGRAGDARRNSRHGRRRAAHQRRHAGRRHRPVRCHATVMTRKGEIVTRQKNELRFGYRHSSLDELVILEATLELEPGDPRHLTKQMQQAWILKRAEQPLSDQKMGQIFKSPGGVSAADVDRGCGAGRRQSGRGGNQRAERQLHRGRTESHEPRCAGIDRASAQGSRRANGSRVGVGSRSLVNWRSIRCRVGVQIGRRNRQGGRADGNGKNEGGRLAWQRNAGGSLSLAAK